MLRLLSVLVLILTFGVGNVWGTKTYEELFTIQSADVVSGTTYKAHTATVSSRGWVITFGGNNNSVGTNSSKRSNCNLSSYTKYAVSPVTSSQVASAFVSTTSISDVSKISYTYTSNNKGSNSTKVYLIYSSNGTTFSKMTLTSGTQGAAISSGTAFEFTKCSGYFGLLFEATNSSSDWRIDAVNITFYEEEEEEKTPTLNLTGEGAFGNVETSSTKDLNFTLTGSNLTANATISVSGTGFSLVTPAGGSLTQTSGSITGSNNITVRFAPTSTGSHNGTLTVTSTGATTQTINLTGTGTAPTPTLSRDPASLNWNTVNKGTELSTKTFTISGSNLTGNLSVSATGGYSVSCGSSITVTSGAPSVTTITVTPPSTETAGTKNGTVTISGGGLASNVTVSCSLTVNEIDQFIDELHNTTGYTSANPHIEAGSYGTTPTIADKAVATSGTCAQQHYHFVGWITAAKYEAGTAIDAGDLQTPTSATGATYYAVWAKQGAGGGGTTYTLVTAASQLSTGDKVVLVDGNPTSTCNGVTGWNGTKDATISSTVANWVQYYVTKSNDNWTLKDETANKFIKSPGSSNEFTYDATTGGSFAADGDGWVSCNSRYLAINSSMYRFYTYSSISTNSYDVFYMYKVGSSITYTDYIAQCCTELGSINGSFFWTTHFYPVWPEKHRLKGYYTNLGITSG